MIYEIVERTPGQYSVRIHHGGWFFPWRWVYSYSYAGSYVRETCSFESAREVALEQVAYFKREKLLPFVHERRDV